MMRTVVAASGPHLPYNQLQRLSVPAFAGRQWCVHPHPARLLRRGIAPQFPFHQMLKSATAATATVWRTTQARVATWFGFILMCVGMFMAILDIQVVATSLPTIQDALVISPDAMSWIQTAYLIAEVIAIPLTGLFTRVLTLRWLFVVAVSVFTLASIGCAYSGDFTILLVFRVLQGFSGGVLIPTVFSAVFLL